MMSFSIADATVKTLYMTKRDLQDLRADWVDGQGFQKGEGAAEFVDVKMITQTGCIWISI